MDKQKLTKDYLLKQISDCRSKIMTLQNEINQNFGAINLCQWMLGNAELAEEQEVPVTPTEEGVTHVVEVPLNGKVPGEIVLG